MPSHFLKRASLAFNRPDVRLPLAQVEILKRYPWPGNIRELQNVIERQIIVSVDGRLRFNELSSTGSHMTKPATTASEVATEPVHDEDLQHQLKLNTIAMLRRTGGKVSGDGGAAELLGVKPTTLASRMKKWGIDARQFKRSQLRERLS